MDERLKTDLYYAHNRGVNHSTFRPEKTKSIYYNAVRLDLLFSKIHISSPPYPIFGFKILFLSFQV